MTENLYVELHCHSNYSFNDGASSLHENLLRAQELGYPALALTDHDNLAGAMEFTQIAQALNIHPIIGAEVTLKGGYHLTLLVETQKGYANLCRLLSYAHISSEHRHPELDPVWFNNHTDGLIALSGCPLGEIPYLAAQGYTNEAKVSLDRYLNWFGNGNVYLEVQQNLVRGDTTRIRRLVSLAKSANVPLVATNNAHYHIRERHRLNDTLVAIRNHTTLDESHRERRANSEFHLKSPIEMLSLFSGLPESLTTTLKISQRCSFDLSSGLGYRFPNYPVPPGFTPDSYLRHICRDAAYRKYGRITYQIHSRLQEELRRITKNGLSGFFLIYYEIIQMAREVMLELGLSDPEIPLEENPPGRGRGSSVAMLVGYLIGISHIDPMQHDLGLDRFLPDEIGIVPDIDLDFPRNIREELIKRVHTRYGWEHTALVGAINTYQMRGVIRTVGKALNLPTIQLAHLAKRVDRSNPRYLRMEMDRLPGFRDLISAPGWRDLVDLAPQIADFPRFIQQHPGGMVISSTPLIETVPIGNGFINNRYVMQWDKDSVDQAGMVKIDFLALGTLSQLQETIHLIKHRTGKSLDLSRIDFEDSNVYDMLSKSDTIGVFQVESAAQMQTLPRLEPRNLKDMAFEVAAVRPGVGATDGVTHFIHRRQGKEEISFDHPLERSVLEKTLGIILYQDQVNELAMHLAGFSAREADQMRRAFAKKNNQEILCYYWHKFSAGTTKRGISVTTARRIFHKFNGGYMFPESHAVAFGVTAYQMSWLKYYYPLEFYVGLLNAQPMGFYSLETIKEDARRHDIPVLHPDVNLSSKKVTTDANSIRLGLSSVRNIGEANVRFLIETREKAGLFRSIADIIERSNLPQKALENLAKAGAFDSLNPNRREVHWEIGLRYRPFKNQLSLQLPTEQDRANLPIQKRWEILRDEYQTLNLSTTGHMMEELRAHLPPKVIPSHLLATYTEGSAIITAGIVIRRQHPISTKAIFMTLEDEHGLIPLIIWPTTWNQYRDNFKAPFLLVWGRVSRREGTMNIIVEKANPIPSINYRPKSKDWH